MKAMFATRLLVRTGLMGLFAVSFMSACSGGDEDSGLGSDTSGGMAPPTDQILTSSSNGVSSSNGSGTGSGTGTTGGDTSPPNGCQPDPNLEGCVGQNFEGENIPLDIYIMFDSSASMNCTIDAVKDQGGNWPSNLCQGDNPRITPVRRAVRQFLEDPLSTGIGVGLGFFGDLPIGNTSCDPADYSDAAVGIAPLPGNATPVLTELDNANPTGETPTGAAIRGACEYVGQWHQQNPGTKKVILFVTDGVPEAPSSNGCDPTIPDAVQAAQDCLNGNPNVETYVLGVGQALDNLNQIAQAGGTDQAYLVDGSDGGDVSQSVLAALNAIRADAVIPCTLPIPTPAGGGVVNTDTVNLGICDAGGASVGSFNVPDANSCGDQQGGWYYEENGTVIQLCNATCDTVSVSGATLYFTLGCDTVTDIPIK